MFTSDRVRKSVRLALVHGCGTLMLGGPVAVLAAESEGPGNEIEAGAAELQEVVVTGSRIRRQDYTANSPITTVTNELFEETSTVGVEAILNQLPQFVPAVTQFNTTNVQNTATQTVGASTVSLRGLGSNRNLVLINGRRGQPVNASLAVDTNSIPSSMIERVEVISGGASAVYGADAIGGVVNFILKDKYEGGTLDARYGITERGLGGEYQISGLFGANVADGRGNVTFGMEYANRDKIDAYDIPWRVDQLNSPNVAGGHPFVSETYLEFPTADNLPSQAAINSIFSELAPGTITRLGVTGRPVFINPTVDGTGTVFTGAGSMSSTATIPGLYRYTGPMEHPDAPGVAWRKRLANGLLTENTEGWVQIPLERFSFSSTGHFDVTSNVRANMAATFSKSSTLTNLGFPASAVNGNMAVIPYGNEIWLDSLADRSALTGYDRDGKPIYDAALLAAAATNPAYLAGGAYGLNCPAVGGCTESNVFPMPAEVRQLMDSRPRPNDDLLLHRAMDYLGSRGTATDNTTYQIVAGLEGRFRNNWTWDASVTHGQTETLVTYQNFASLDRWRAVAQSPNFGVNFRGQNNEEAGGQYSGVATCTTGLPLVREFEPSQDCLAAITANMQNTTLLEQQTAEVNLAGDLLELPAGALQFSVGAGYRSEDYVYRTDNLTAAESFIETALGLYPTSNTRGYFDTHEVFGELLVPLIGGVPGIQQLNLELGARYSDYSTVGGVETFKALLDWTITPWARMRGGFQTANRAPNIGELYLSPTYLRSLAGARFGDQCSMQSEGPQSTNPAFNVGGADGAAFSMDLCRAMMGSIADNYYAETPENQPTATGLARAVGNPNLQSEKAKTWTAGLVLSSPSTHPFWSGFRGSVDWYRIRITDMIAQEGGDAVFQRCLDPALNPTGDAFGPACSVIGRDPLTGLVSYTSVSYTNQGASTTSGMDFQVDWSGMYDFGRIGVNVLANYNMENITQEAANIAPIEWVGTSGCALELQCMGYDYKIFSTFSWSEGPWNASLRWLHYPTIDASAAATDPNTRQRGVHSAYNLFSANVGYRVNSKLSLRLGIENLFDTLPPLQGGEPWRQAENPLDYNRAATRAGGGVYDPLGRRYFINASLKL